MIFENSMVEVGIEFLTHFGSNLGPKMDPNWAQNGSRIRFKNDQIFDTFWGGVLDPFFSFFPAFFGPKLGPCPVAETILADPDRHFFGGAQDEIF